MKNTGHESKMARSINSKLKLVREFAPNLVVARASFIPFDDIVDAEYAGPQGDNDPFGQEPFFKLDTRGVEEGETVEIFVTAKDVTVSVLQRMPNGDQVLADEFATTLAGVHDYMRQLPRPATSFRRKKRGAN